MSNSAMKFFNKETIVYFIAIVITLVWASATLFLLGKALHLVGESADLTAVLSVYATITAVFGTPLNHYFGSTKGSQERNAQMIELAKAIPTSPLTPSESEAFKALRQRAKDANIVGWEAMNEDQLKATLG